MKSSADEKITISKINQDAKVRIDQITGVELKRVILENGAVVHALKKEDHHLMRDDFKKIGRIINSTTDISLQPKKHRNNQVLLFKEQKDNGLQILMEIRPKKQNLALLTMYRQQKAK